MLQFLFLRKKTSLKYYKTATDVIINISAKKENFLTITNKT